MSALLVFASVSAPPHLAGQTTTASITGQVRDETGAVIPEASLTVTNTETGLARAATTDTNGRYRVQNLPVGSYQVDASYAGFKSVTRSGITLTVGQAATVDITLPVGSVAERVEVTAEAPLVDVNTAVLGGLVDQRAIQDLPLNGRSFIELANLQAGTVNAITGGRSESQGYGQKLSISGGR
ncbi:MAG TPA: carboxypeptidase-like regulatory domain-containing protein, partial [Methylomirabilota bacterium]|nr:carboxypeptidase-like regulatory domain-containing protein [Methylomirabilota bacterium]